jgi:hypothetical protein
MAVAFRKKVDRPVSPRCGSQWTEFRKQRALRGWTGTNHGGRGEHGVENKELWFVERSGNPWRFLKLLQELDDRRRGGHLADPEEDHPLDDLGF